MSLQHKEEVGTLQRDEHHPAAYEALDWIKQYVMINPQETMHWREAFSSTALTGNRLSEICGETLNRILQGKPVSERYLLGLAWTIKTLKENKNEKRRCKTKTKNGS